MRFLYYDRVTALRKGVSITGVKSFALSEEFLRGHFSGKAVVPGVIMIEAMAQLLGWLVIYSHDFRLSAIMSLVQDAAVTPDLRPGCTAEIHAELLSTSRRDSLGKARMSVDGRVIATVDRLIYSHIHDVDPEGLRRLFGYYSGLVLQEAADGGR